MSSMFYPKLALSNLKKSKRTYLPYLLTCILTVMLYYIMNALARNEGLKDMPGAYALLMIMTWSTVVVAIFAVIFLFYTNSFLVKQRKKEFGLYQVLGMDKGNITKMMTWETIYTSVVSLTAGLIGGILLGKLMFLFLLKLINFEVPLKFAVEMRSVRETVILFLCIFVTSLLFNLLQVQRVNPSELLQGGKQGEKEPKAKWFIALLGFLCLGIGYYIALTTESPLSAIGKFFAAVILVIFGTYLLFTAGSIVFLKGLRKNKGFYYNTKHFISVSGMIYRMKQNAVGLANICVLSTVVLVLVSTSISMYAGMEDIMETRFPYDVMLKNYEGNDLEANARIDQIVEEETRNYGVSLENQAKYQYGSLNAIVDKNKMFLEENSDVAYSMEKFYGIELISLEEYNRMEGAQAELLDGEVMVYSPEAEFSYSEIEIQGSQFRVREFIKSMNVVSDVSGEVVPNIYIIMPDKESIMSLLKQYTNYGYDMYYKNVFDLKGEKENCQKAAYAIRKQVNSELSACSTEIRDASRKEFFGIYGGFLFLGIFLGFMFLMATVLIIYYKQISEGMDDKERFQIMQKVGMGTREIQKTIRSQVLLVFFLPLAVAVIHIAAAFKVITKLLAIMNLVNVSLFLTCTVLTVIVFAIFYAVVFGITAKEYYKIIQ